MVQKRARSRAREKGQERRHYSLTPKQRSVIHLSGDNCADKKEKQQAETGARESRAERVTREPPGGRRRRRHRPPEPDLGNASAGSVFHRSAPDWREAEATNRPIDRPTIPRELAESRASPAQASQPLFHGPHLGKERISRASLAGVIASSIRRTERSAHGASIGPCQSACQPIKRPAWPVSSFAACPSIHLASWQQRASE